MIPTTFNTPETLLFAIGNSARGDDGLGWAFAEALVDDGRFLGQVEYRYQLQVEDAELAASHSRVLFVDAWKDPHEAAFQWTAIYPRASVAFTSHYQTPASILFLCQQLYGATPAGRLLAIRGVSWELGQGLSPEAWDNLEQALNWFFTAKHVSDEKTN